MNTTTDFGIDSIDDEDEESQNGSIDMKITTAAKPTNAGSVVFVKKIKNPGQKTTTKFGKKQ